MCAGVGKTYAMLEAARRARRAGRDVVIGYVVTCCCALLPKGLALAGAASGSLSSRLPSSLVIHSLGSTTDLSAPRALAWQAGPVLHVRFPRPWSVVVEAIRRAQNWPSMSKPATAGASNGGEGGI